LIEPLPLLSVTCTSRMWLWLAFLEDYQTIVKWFCESVHRIGDGSLPDSSTAGNLTPVLWRTWKIFGRKLVNYTRHWNKTVCGNQDRKLGDIQSGLKALESEGEKRVLTRSEPSMLQNVVSDQWSVSKNVEAIWRQKSRQTWCRLGDRNTQFFHLAANIRRSRITITQIKYKGTTLFYSYRYKVSCCFFLFWVVYYTGC